MFICCVWTKVSDHTLNFVNMRRLVESASLLYCSWTLDLRFYLRTLTTQVKKLNETKSRLLANCNPRHTSDRMPNRGMRWIHEPRFFKHLTCTSRQHLWTQLSSVWHSGLEKWKMDRINRTENALTTSVSISTDKHGQIMSNTSQLNLWQDLKGGC